jgi:hypothetical protein
MRLCGSQHSEYYGGGRAGSIVTFDLMTSKYVTRVEIHISGSLEDASTLWACSGEKIGCWS